MSSLDARETLLAAGGAGLREWRRAKGWTLDELRREIDRQTGGKPKGNPGNISRWETGQVLPGPAFVAAYRALGAPLDAYGELDEAPESGESPKPRAPSPKPTRRSKNELDERADRAMLEVQGMLDGGAPLDKVYAVAARSLTGFLQAGLSPDRQRAWDMMLKMLRNGAAERGKIQPIDRHPDWARVIEFLLEAVRKVPGGSKAILEAAQAWTGQEKAA